MVVEKLTEHEIIATSSICFHCQQAVEKFLKAFLITNGKNIKKTHNIEFLLSECADIDSIFAEVDPKELSEFGVDARYPGDMYIPNEIETLEYKKIAFDIKNLVENRVYKFIGYNN
ncbi:MAG: HEPN domain-containing protein [Bacteroidales bacterium]|nr:HEPN domain-containing protein [Bacteroidales bacterium]